MEVPKDYNVKGGLISFGDNILLEIFGEMTSVRDVQQVLSFFSIFSI